MVSAANPSVLKNFNLNIFEYYNHVERLFFNIILKISFRNVLYILYILHILYIYMVLQ